MTSRLIDIPSALGYKTCRFPLAIAKFIEITIYDTTGTALQDVAAAADAYEKAVSTREGESFNFFEPR